MTTDLRALVRDLMPALDAYEMAGRRSYYKDGVLHWEMTAQYWDAQRLRERVEAALDAQAAEAVAWRSKNFDPLLSGGFAWSFTADPGSVTARHEGLYVNVAADAIAAARYRWLRDYAGIIEESGPLVFHADKDARPGTPIDGRLLDAAIDAAIAALSQGGRP